MVRENIANLTSLWQIVGKKANAYVAETYFDYCAVDNSEWPNKLWFHKDLNKSSLVAAKKQLLATDVELSIPYFDVYESQSYELLEADGFEKRSKQISMSLDLTQPYEKSSTIRTERVANARTALLWEQLFQRAFNYKIDHQLLLPHYEHTDYLIAYDQEDQPVGTAILHYTEDSIVGIHAMGIIPEMRRKGLAEQMMRDILNQSWKQGFRYATLQASAMGKGLYEKLGFVEQFVMKNYVLA